MPSLQPSVDGWLLSTPLSATRYVICRFRHCVIISTFAAGRHPLLPTFASRCSIALVLAIHHLCRSRQWLVVLFSARPAAYQLNYQSENVFMFPHLDLFLTYLEYVRAFSTCRSLSTSRNGPE